MSNNQPLKIMKKEYIRPHVEKQELTAPQLLTNSGVNSDKGINYGGVDNSGSKDPNANRNNLDWEDWEEDE